MFLHFFTVVCGDQSVGSFFMICAKSLLRVMNPHNNLLRLSSVLSDVLTPHYPWQSSDVSVGMLPPHHGNDFGLEPPGHNKENEDDVEAMSTDSSSSSSDSD